MLVANALCWFNHGLAHILLYEVLEIERWIMEVNTVILEKRPL
jgi:hypothetical protein